MSNVFSLTRDTNGAAFAVPVFMRVTVASLAAFIIASIIIPA